MKKIKPKGFGKFTTKVEVIDEADSLPIEAKDSTPERSVDYFFSDITVSHADGNPLESKMLSSNVSLLSGWLRVGAANRQLQYPNRTETISEEDLFSPNSLESLVGKPITVDHPPSFFLDGNGDPSRIQGLIHQDFRTEIDEATGEKYLLAPFTVFGKDAIDTILSEDKIQVSPGYLVRRVPTDNGQYLQKDRLYDHIALVNKGRSGDDVRVRLDSADDTQTISEDFPLSSETLPDIGNSDKAELESKDSDLTNTKPKVSSELLKYIAANADVFSDAVLDGVEDLPSAKKLWLREKMKRFEPDFTLNLDDVESGVIDTLTQVFTLMETKCNDLESKLAFFIAEKAVADSADATPPVKTSILESAVAAPTPAAIDLKAARAKMIASRYSS